jgi:hypothetical protein
MTFLRPAFTAALLLLVPAPTLAADAAPQADVQSDSALSSPLARQPLDRLSATRERPLFSPTRRPPPVPVPIVHEPEPPPPPPPPPDVALFGIVMDGDEARAIVRTSPAANVVRVRIGDDIGGWKVAQIEGRRLVLALDGRVATFTMFTGNSAAGAPNANPALQAADKQLQNQAQQPQTQQNQLRQNDPAPLAAPRRPHRTRQ